MNIRLQISMIVISLGLLVMVWQFIRYGKLRPAYALLWIITTFALFLLVLLRGLVKVLADFFQVDYPPSLVFSVGLLFVVFLLINQTLSLSLLSRRNKEIAQNHAILQWRLEQLEREIIEQREPE